MYPAQTSFIPLTVALVKFVAEGGSIWGNYPYWYLGSTPFRYLTGPVVPAVILSLHALFGGYSLFDWSLVLIVAAWLVAALGWGFLAWQLLGKRRVGVLVGVLYLLLPWHIVSALALGEVSVVVASSFGPWVLVSFISLAHQLKKSSAKHNLDSDSSNSASLRPTLTSGLNVSRLGNWARFVMFLNWFTSFTLVPIILLAVLLLINTVASIPTILGLLILGLVLYKHPTEGLKRAGLVVFFGGLLTIWWYDPGYWLRILFAPSFGGRSVIGTIWYVVGLARTLVPVVLAFIVVVWRVKPKNNFEKFAYLWLGSFVGLTLVRFAANIHFWLDWTSWFGEIEVGLALILVGPVSRFLPVSARSMLKPQVNLIDNVELRAAGSPSTTATHLTMFIALGLFVVSWFLVFANRNFWLPRKNIENTVEWQVADKLKNIVEPNDTVFLSGTTAFWLDSLVDIRQVRGGADQVGLRPELAKVVWEIRMGTDSQKSIDDLKKLGINYLVVHSNYSKEFYHDFENPGKFEGIYSLIKVYDEDGDIIYHISEK